MKSEREAGDRALVTDQREHAGRIAGREDFEGRLRGGGIGSRHTGTHGGSGPDI